MMQIAGLILAVALGCVVILFAFNEAKSNGKAKKL